VNQASWVADDGVIVEPVSEEKQAPAVRRDTRGAPDHLEVGRLAPLPDALRRRTSGHLRVDERRADLRVRPFALPTSVYDRHGVTEILGDPVDTSCSRYTTTTCTPRRSALRRPAPRHGPVGSRGRVPVAQHPDTRDRLETTGNASRGDIITNASDRRVGVGILGAGNILGRYVTGMSRFPQLAVVGCAARSAERARQAAEDAGIGHFDSVGELLASPRTPRRGPSMNGPTPQATEPCCRADPTPNGGAARSPLVTPPPSCPSTSAR
jgi:hypothetical protein